LSLLAIFLYPSRKEESRRRSGKEKGHVGRIENLPFKRDQKYLGIPILYLLSKEGHRILARCSRRIKKKKASAGNISETAFKKRHGDLLCGRRRYLLSPEKEERHWSGFFSGTGPERGGKKRVWIVGLPVRELTEGALRHKLSAQHLSYGEKEKKE